MPDSLSCMPGFQTLYFQIPQATISGLISRIPGIRIPLQGGRISSKRDLPSNFTACLRHLPSSHSLNPHYPNPSSFTRFYDRRNQHFTSCLSRKSRWQPAGANAGAWVGAWWLVIGGNIRLGSFVCLVARRRRKLFVFFWYHSVERILDYCQC